LRTACAYRLQDRLTIHHRTDTVGARRFAVDGNHCQPFSRTLPAAWADHTEQLKPCVGWWLGSCFGHRRRCVDAQQTRQVTTRWRVVT
jgi:hypothetical protein